MSRACVAVSVMYLSVCHGCSDSLISWLVVGFMTFGPMASCTELAKRSARFRSKKEIEHDGSH